MYKLLKLLLVMTVTSVSLTAQDSTSKTSDWKTHFHSFNTFQLLNGSTTTSIAINTVNGLQYGKFFGGIGTGFDYYYHTTIPLFMEARFDLATRKGKLQLFGNAGLSIPFTAQNKNQEYKSGSYKTGGLYGGGVDYLVPVKQEAVILGVAFSNKQVIQLVDNNVWNPILNNVENIPIEDKYSFNRISIRIGWMF
jgi:hypothetical protein